MALGLGLLLAGCGRTESTQAVGGAVGRNTPRPDVPAPPREPANTPTPRPTGAEFVEPAGPGGSIVFMSNRGEYDNLYLLSLEDARVGKLTTLAGIDAFPKVSPAGTRILYHSGTQSLLPEVIVLDANGGFNRLTNNDSGDLSPDWSPDGRQIVFTSDRDGDFDLYIMDADGTNQRRLMEHEGIDLFSHWSPDGTQIVFTSDTRGNNDIYIGEVVELTDSRAFDSFPTWSPDGSHIAFASDRTGNDEIWIMEADGSNPIQLTDNPARDIAPNWTVFRYSAAQ